MKKILCGLLTGLMLLLSGCGGRTGTGSGFQPDFTAGHYIYGTMVATEDGYFAQVLSTVYYIEAETMDHILFCADPACDHQRFSGTGTNENCLSRYAGGSTAALQYYDGELYFTRFADDEKGHIDALCAVKADGTGLRTVQELFNQGIDPWTNKGDGSHFNYPYAILGDTIVFCSRASIVNVGKLGEPLSNARELFSYGVPAISVPGDFERRWDIWVDGEYLYYCGNNCPDGDRAVRGSQLLYRYDPATEENTLVWRSDEQTGAYSVEGWYLRDGIFYYYITEHLYEDSEPGVWRCDLATMETEKITDRTAGDRAEFDREYAYLMDYRTNVITVISLETGEEAAALDFGAAVEADGFTLHTFFSVSFAQYGVVGTDDTWLFVMCQTDVGNMLYAIEKERFSENAWKLVIADYYD